MANGVWFRVQQLVPEVRVSGFSFTDPRRASAIIRHQSLRLDEALGFPCINPSFGTAGSFTTENDE
jgi:hypothetical protein